MSDFKITDKSGIKLKTANKYVTEDLAVTLTDDDINNIVAENIKKDISILGVTGTFDGIPTGITPSGKIEITNTEEIDVSEYASAQIVDSNLSAENIKEGVTILGITGTHKGGGKAEVEVYTLSETMPSVSKNHSAVEINGKAYIFGGNVDTSTGFKTILEYDPSTNTCTKLSTTLPSIRYAACSVAINNKAYIISGYDNPKNTNLPLPTIIEYDPFTNTCTTVYNSNQAYNGFGYSTAVAINGKAYMFGGYDYSTSLNTYVKEYDPITNTKTTKATLPKSIKGAMSVEIMNKAYIFGGNGTDNVKQNTILKYDPSTDKCTTLSVTLPTALAYISAVAINDKAYIFGGTSTEGIDNGIIEFDPVTNTITTLNTTLPRLVTFASSTSINGKAYIFGGNGGSDIGLTNTILRVDNLG